jgi:hypothetical protein
MGWWIGEVLWIQLLSGLVDRCHGSNHPMDRWIGAVDPATHHACLLVHFFTGSCRHLGRIIFGTFSHIYLLRWDVL